jgi:putative N6-adenine-specific DNA methylase
MSLFPTTAPRGARAPATPAEPAWFASCPPGLELAVEAELRAHPLSAARTLAVEAGGVAFQAPHGVGARLATELATPSRLLLRVAEGRVQRLEDLARLVRGVDWSPFLDPRDPGLLEQLGVAIGGQGSRLRHRERSEEKLRLALADALRGRRLGAHAERGPAQHLLLRLEGDRAQLSLCAGGELLHRRGWRQEAGGAPLRENLAACLLWMAGWTGDEALLDPFCGAGTIPIEAARMATGRSPFVGRRLACEAWPGVALAPARPRLPLSVPVVGADRDAAALEMAAANARRAEVSVRLLLRDVAQIEAPAPRGLVVANPPYGHRLGQDVREVYAWLGRRLRGPLAGWRALFLSPSAELAARVDRRARCLCTFQNGGLRVGVWAVEAEGGPVRAPGSD